MILGTKNTSGGPKMDIGGPCPKPYINITFWGDCLAPEAEKPVLEWQSAIWAGILIFSVLERSVWTWEAQKPQYCHRNIEVSSPGRPATPQNP